MTTVCCRRFSTVRWQNWPMWWNIIMISSLTAVLKVGIQQCEHCCSSTSSRVNTTMSLNTATRTDCQGNDCRSNRELAEVMHCGGVNAFMSSWNDPNKLPKGIFPTWMPHSKSPIVKQESNQWSSGFKSFVIASWPTHSVQQLFRQVWIFALLENRTKFRTHFTLM